MASIASLGYLVPDAAYPNQKIVTMVLEIFGWVFNLFSTVFQDQKELTRCSSMLQRCPTNGRRHRRLLARAPSFLPSCL